MLAFAMMATIRHHANRQSDQTEAIKKTKRLTRIKQKPSTCSAGQCKKSGVSPSGSADKTSSQPTSSHGRCGEEPIRQQRSGLM
jgi:hypothetical protein